MSFLWDGLPIPRSLNHIEQATVNTIRATVFLDPHPDPSILSTVSSLAWEAHTQGLPYDQRAVLESLYPHYSWDRAVLMLPQEQINQTKSKEQK